jgi:hypothetical protein
VPSYTFYPNRPDGSALMFEEADLPNDEAAVIHARKVLDAHVSSIVVDVWDGDRDVATVRRPHGSNGAAQG